MRHSPKRTYFPLAAALLASVGITHAAVTPSDIHRKRYTDSVTVTATGTAATLDGVPFPLGAATAVTAIGFHDLVITDGGVTTTYRFIVRNSERSSTEDGIPTMKPLRFVQDASSAFAGGQLNVMAPAVYPQNMPIPVAFRLAKGASYGAAAGDPLFLNGQVISANYLGNTTQLRRGWGSTILPASAAPGSRPFDAKLHSLEVNAPIQIEPTTTWTNKSGTLGSETWGPNARIYLTSTANVPAGVTLTIGEGTVVRCAPGVEIWVRPGGTINVTGTTANPVVFAPDSTSNLWGGVWLQPASGANIARFTAKGALFCCWGSNQNWFATAPAGEPTKNFPHHRNQQPCFASASGAICSLTDCALIGPTGLNQTRGAALAANGGSLIFNRVLMQRIITGGEQEDCPTFDFDSVAVLECTEPGLDVDSEGFTDSDNDGIYLVPRGRTFTLDKCVIGWTKDDGIDTGADGAGSVICRNCWFENCIHEAISNSGVNRVPQSIDGVHFNSGQGMECGYGGPHSLVERTLITGCMVGARYGDNYGSSSGTNGSGTSQYDGDMTVRDAFCIYNLFHDTLAIDFSRFDYQNQRFTMVGSKVSMPGDLAAQNGAEDSGNSLWNPASDGPLIANFMPTPNSAVGMDFPTPVRQGTTAAFPSNVPVRLSTFSSNVVSATWKMVGLTTPEAGVSTELASGTLTWQPGQTVQSFAPPAPPTNAGYSLIVLVLESPVNAEVMGGGLWYFAATAPPFPDQQLVSKNASGWSYHSTVTPGGWTNAVDWPPLDSASRKWTNVSFVETANWKLNRTAPVGWGNIGAAAPYLVFGSTVTEVPTPVTVYFRKTFTVTNTTDLTSLVLECMADDGASVYINGSRVSPITWGLDPGTNVGGSLYYNQLSTRFKGNGASEAAYDSLTLSGSSLPVLNAAPALNVIAVEVHQNSVDSSDCSFDAALKASYAVPQPIDRWGVCNIGDTECLYWSNALWTVETSTGLNADWVPRPELKSPLKIVEGYNRLFIRLRVP